jgi:molybdopterin synthase catalytic subunit
MATARTTAAKKAPRKKAAAKKAPTKKAPKTNGAHEPFDGVVKGELKYKVKAAQLEFEAADELVMKELRPQLQKLIDRTKRNSPAWKAANKARIDAINELIESVEPKLAEGYAVINVNTSEGTYRAVHDPDSVGRRLS